MLIAGALALGTTADAQTNAASPTRSGSLAPAGQGPGAEASAPTRASNRSRASVKAQTKAQSQSGDLVPAGQAPAPYATLRRDTDSGKPTVGTDSTRSRADVKAQTRSARATGSLQPAGEAPMPSTDAPKK